MCHGHYRFHDDTIIEVGELGLVSCRMLRTPDSSGKYRILVASTFPLEYDGRATHMKSDP